MEQRRFFWGVPRILKALEAVHVTVKFEGGRAYLDTCDPAFPFKRSNVARILPHLEARRADVVAHFRDLERQHEEARNPSAITRVPVTHPARTVPPYEARAALFDAMRFTAAVFRGVVVWFSRYDRATGRIDHRNTCFPPHATEAAVAYSEPYHDPAEPFGRPVEYVTEWYDLPNASPPPGWKNPEPEKRKRRGRNPWAHVPKESDGNLPD